MVKQGVKGFSEQYSVRFEFQNDSGFWEKTESETYITASKGRHKEVEQRFLKDMTGSGIKFKVLEVRYH